MKHNHSDPCSHEKLQHCKRCDVVECESCSKEWQSPKTTVTYGSGIFSNLGFGNTLNCSHKDLTPCISTNSLT